MTGHPARNPVDLERMTLPEGPAPGASDDIIHGLYNTYRNGDHGVPCPCTACRAANAENSRQYRQRNRTTTLTVDGRHGDMLTDFARRHRIPKTEAMRRAIRLLHLIEASDR